MADLKMWKVNHTDSNGTSLVTDVIAHGVSQQLIGFMSFVREDEDTAVFMVPEIRVNYIEQVIPEQKDV